MQRNINVVVITACRASGSIHYKARGSSQPTSQNMYPHPATPLPQAFLVPSWFFNHSIFCTSPHRGFSHFLGCPSSPPSLAGPSVFSALTWASCRAPLVPSFLLSNGEDGSHHRPGFGVAENFMQGKHPARCSKQYILRCNFFSHPNSRFTRSIRLRNESKIIGNKRAAEVVSPGEGPGLLLEPQNMEVNG